MVIVMGLGEIIGLSQCEFQQSLVSKKEEIFFIFVVQLVKCKIEVVGCFFCYYFKDNLFEYEVKDKVGRIE